MEITTLQNDRLFNYILKKKDRKENRKNEPYPRCSESFTFRCSALNALSRNYDICISHGKTCPDGAWLENFSRQILKVKEKINYISNGKKYLNDDVNLSCAG